MNLTQSAAARQDKENEINQSNSNNQSIDFKGYYNDPVQNYRKKINVVNTQLNKQNSVVIPEDFQNQKINMGLAVLKSTENKLPGWVKSNA